MTPDKLIELAKQAGGSKYVNRHYPDKASFGFMDAQLQAFVELVRNEALGAQAPDLTADLEHEARLMRARMERLQAERDGIVLAIVERLERACGATGMPPTLIRREFMTEQTQ